ncbi:MAG: HlyD family efflux transporter periplasmic adaptor subunit [Candidatus Paceibacterota bacterium]|jgi:HlyD family secretion protein
MVKILQTIKKLVIVHKIWTVVIIVIILFGGYILFKNMSTGPAESIPVFSQVKRASIKTTVSGTGQISTSNQIEITSNASGELIYLNAKVGDLVKKGTLLGQIDASEAKHEYETAKLAYQNLINIDKRELSDAIDEKEKAESDLSNYYIDARSTLSSSSTNTNDILIGLENIFNGYLGANNTSRGKIEKEYIERAETQYYKAKKLFNEYIKEYRTISKDTENSKIELILGRMKEVSNELVLAVKYTKDAVIYVKDRDNSGSSSATSAYESIISLSTDANSTLSDIVSIENNIKEAKRTLKNAELDLKELEDGPDILDLRAEELSLIQKEEAYYDHFIRAPFNGIIASVSAKKGDEVSSSTEILTLITEEKIAEISLNEIDVARIKNGNKAILVFDAVEDITIEGEVTEINLIGEVSQGVVNYTIKIAFESDDERIKSGMTVTAEIITEQKENVLTISSGAIKTEKEKNYVETKQGKKYITTGITDDIVTEVINGLEEGEEYIEKYSTATTENVKINNNLFPSGGRSGGTTGPAIRSIQ